MRIADLPPRPFARGLAARERPGPGDRVLWLHGYTLDASSWETMWGLMPGWHHIGLDLPGHGASDPIPPEGNIRELGERLAEACQREGIRHLVALSFGTITATQIALELPDFFRSLVLGAPSLAGGPQDPEVGKIYAQMFAMYRRGARGPELLDLWMSCRAWDGVEKVPGLRAELGALVARHPWAELGSYAVRQFTWPAQDEEALARIRTPTLVVVGDAELPPFVEVADRLARRLPEVRRCTLQDTGHLCMLQSPGPSAAAITEHLRRHAVQAPPEG